MDVLFPTLAAAEISRQTPYILGNTVITEGRIRRKEGATHRCSLSQFLVGQSRSLTVLCLISFSISPALVSTTPCVDIRVGRPELATWLKELHLCLIEIRQESRGTRTLLSADGPRPTEREERQQPCAGKPSI